MKRSFACFLSLAVCLSGCTPAASEPAGEAPAIAETAPAEETVENAAFPVGSLVGNRDDAPLPGKMYRIWQSEDSPQSLSWNWTAKRGRSAASIPLKRNPR